MKGLSQRIDDLYERKSPLSPLGAVAVDVPAARVVAALREKARARGAGFVEVDLSGAADFEQRVAEAFVASLAEPGGTGTSQREELAANLRARPALAQRYPEQQAQHAGVVRALESGAPLPAGASTRHALCWLYSLRAPLVVALHGLESCATTPESLAAGLTTLRDKTRQTLLVVTCPSRTWTSLRTLMPRSGRDRWEEPLTEP